MSDDGEKQFHGVPYDFRPPTVARFKSRWWNPDDPRILTPKSFGAGWDVNLYWLTHPHRLLGRKSGRSAKEENDSR